MLYAVTQDTLLPILNNSWLTFLLPFAHFLLMGVCDWSAQSVTVKIAENKLALKIDKVSGFAEPFYWGKGLAIVFTPISPSPGKRGILKAPWLCSIQEKLLFPTISFLPRRRTPDSDCDAAQQHMRLWSGDGLRVCHIYTGNTNEELDSGLLPP